MNQDPLLTDEHAGKGGSYRVDKSGKRTLVHRTGMASEEAATETSPAAAPAATEPNQSKE